MFARSMFWQLVLHVAEQGFNVIIYEYDTLYTEEIGTINNNL